MRKHEKLELTSRKAAETKMEEGKAKAAGKRAHVSLTIEQKVEILDLIEKKTSYSFCRRNMVTVSLQFPI